MCHFLGDPPSLLIRRSIEIIVSIIDRDIAVSAVGIRGLEVQHEFCIILLYSSITLSS
jgi:hypothetical protein